LLTCGEVDDAVGQGDSGADRITHVLEGRPFLGAPHSENLGALVAPKFPGGIQAERDDATAGGSVKPNPTPSRNVDTS